MNVSSRPLRIVAVLGATALAGCARDAEDHEPSYNKGCPYDQCNPQFNPDFDPDAGAVGPAPPFVVPPGCPAKRGDEPRSGLTADDVRALLPGVYRSCSRERSVQIWLDDRGRLMAQGESLVLGACGSARCDVAWGADVGSLQLWRDPIAFTFEGRSSSDGYVRDDD